MERKNVSAAVLAAIVAAALVLCLISVFGVGSGGYMSAANIKQGLDLKGGVSIVYEADTENPTSTQMSSALSLIRQRLDSIGGTESEVSQQGTNRIRVEIPGVEDAEQAIADIGQTAQLYFVDPDGNVVLTGGNVTDAQTMTYTNSAGVLQYGVSLELDSDGAVAFSAATGAFIGSPIYILLDDTIISAPTVQSQITNGSASITGSFTREEADSLSSLIRAGALPFNLEVISMNSVGARLGADSLERSLIAGAVGMALVLVFMLLVYRVAGLAADIALFLYLGLELVILSVFGITLTLPGIAGIILSVGMAVDANVIIFERLKEELRAGRSMKFALDTAFSKAFSAILDGNVTTLIAAVVLFILGTGTIKGFAQTLAIGIIISMFSAIVVTRLLLKAFAGLGVKNPALYGAGVSKRKEAAK